LPTEKRVVQTHVMRAGDRWIALLTEGSHATYDKRLSPLFAIQGSARRNGYQAESSITAATSTAITPTCSGCPVSASAVRC
jgi:hypothetical protein